MALLVCLALFLSATVRARLADLGGRPRRTSAGARSPGVAAPADSTGGSAAVGRLDQATGLASVGPVSMTLPGAPYRTRPDPARLPGVLDACFLAWAPVHTRSTGSAPWTAAVLLGRLHPDVGAGRDLEERARAATAELAAGSSPPPPPASPTSGSPSTRSTGAPGCGWTAQVHYRVPGCPAATTT